MTKTELRLKPELRLTGVGGSEAALIIGSDKFSKSQFDVWLEKKKMTDPPDEPDPEMPAS